MTNDPRPGHSGSRWEQVGPDPAIGGDRPGPAPALSSADAPAADAPPADPRDRRRDRRRRRPFVALLAVVLALGTASAGVALARAQDDGVVDPGSGTSSAPADPRGGPGVRQDHGPDGAGHHGRGGADRAPSNQGDQDGSDDQPAAPSARETT